MRALASGLNRSTSTPLPTVCIRGHLGQARAPARRHEFGNGRDRIDIRQIAPQQRAIELGELILMDVNDDLRPGTAHLKMRIPVCWADAQCRAARRRIARHLREVLLVVQPGGEVRRAPAQARPPREAAPPCGSGAQRSGRIGGNLDSPARALTLGWPALRACRTPRVRGRRDSGPAPS